MTDQCRCGKCKVEHNAFCNLCWMQLPYTIQRDIRMGVEGAVDRAHAFFAEREAVA